MKRSFAHLPPCILLIVLLIPGCVMYVPLSEFEDAQGIPQGTLRTGATVENGYMYRIVRGKKAAESIGWFTATSAAYGLTDDIAIRYSTWYTSLPVISCRVSVPIVLLRREDLSVGLVPTWTNASGGQLNINDNMNHQIMRIWSLSMPVGYRHGATAFYVAPRLWRSMYDEGWYEQSTDNNGNRIESGIGQAVYRSDNMSVAFGVSMHFDRFMITPEGVLHSVDGRNFTTMGVRFGIDY